MNNKGKRSRLKEAVFAIGTYYQDERDKEIVQVVSRYVHQKSRSKRYYVPVKVVAEGTGLLYEPGQRYQGLTVDVEYTMFITYFKELPKLKANLLIEEGI